LVFSKKIYQADQEIWKEESILIVEGTTSDKDDEIKILVNTVWELNIENKTEVLNKLRETPFAENKVNKWKQKM